MKKMLMACLLSSSMLLYSNLAHALSTTPANYNLGGDAATRDVLNAFHFGTFDQGVWVDQFNPNLGTLTSISISMIGKVLTDFTLKNTGGSSFDATASNYGRLVLNTDATPIITVSNMSPTGYWTATEQNTVLPQANPLIIEPDPNWRYDLGVTGTKAASTTLSSSAWLAFFTGIDSVLFTGYSLNTSTGTTTTGASTDLVAIVNAWAQEDFSITYNYDETTVPEPGTFMLLGSGLLLIFGYRQRLARRKG